MVSSELRISMLLGNILLRTTLIATMELNRDTSIGYRDNSGESGAIPHLDVKLIIGSNSIVSSSILQDEITLNTASAQSSHSMDATASSSHLSSEFPIMSGLDVKKIEILMLISGLMRLPRNRLTFDPLSATMLLSKMSRFTPRHMIKQLSIWKQISLYPAFYTNIDSGESPMIQS